MIALNNAYLSYSLYPALFSFQRNEDESWKLTKQIELEKLDISLQRTSNISLETVETGP